MLAGQPCPVWKLQVPTGQSAMPSGGTAGWPPPSRIGSPGVPPPLPPVCVPPSGDVLSLDEHPKGPKMDPHESKRTEAHSKALMASIYERPVRPASLPLALEPRALDAAPVSSGGGRRRPSTRGGGGPHISIDTLPPRQSRSRAARTPLRVGWTRDSLA